MKYAVNPFAPAAGPCPCFPLIFASTLQRCCSLNILTPASSKVLTSDAAVAESALTVHFNPTIFSEANARAVCCNFAVRFSPPALFSGPQFSVVVVSARWCVLLSQIKRNHCCGTRYLLPIPPDLPTSLPKEAQASIAFFMSGFRSCGSLKYCK